MDSFSYHYFRSWSFFQCLPLLEVLRMNNNRIERIEFSVPSEENEMYLSPICPNLRTVELINNRLNSLETLLSWIRLLSSNITVLSFNGNPFLQDLLQLRC